MTAKRVRDADGRMRYRGEQGRRGAPGRLRVAIVDLTKAIEAFSVAKDELEQAMADEARRDRLLVSAHGRIGLGVRFAGQVMNGRKPPKRTAPKTQLRLFKR